MPQVLCRSHNSSEGVTDPAGSAAAANLSMAEHTVPEDATDPNEADDDISNE